MLGTAVSIAVTVLWMSGSLGSRVVLLAVALTVTAALGAMLGLIGDYAQRIYRQSSGRPFYLVRRVHETPELVSKARVS